MGSMNIVINAIKFKWPSVKTMSTVKLEELINDGRVKIFVSLFFKRGGLYSETGVCT